MEGVEWAESSGGRRGAGRWSRRADLNEALDRPGDAGIDDRRPLLGGPVGWLDRNGLVRSGGCCGGIDLGAAGCFGCRVSQ